MKTEKLTKEDAIKIVTEYLEKNESYISGIDLKDRAYKFENNTLFVDAHLTQAAYEIDPKTKKVIKTYRLGD